MIFGIAVFLSSLSWTSMTKRLHEEPEPKESFSDTKRVKKRKLDKSKKGKDGDRVVQKSKLSKEERRELKKLRKANEDRIVQENSDQREPEREGEGPETDKRIAKAIRKAEKAQVKPGEVDVTPRTENGKQKAEISKAERKAQRRIEKAQRKAAAESHIVNGNSSLSVHVEHGVINGHSSTNSPVPNNKPISGVYEQHPELTALPEAEIQSFLSSKFIDIKDPSSSSPLRPITEFSHLPKASQTPAFLKFKSPTPIQSAAWPFLFSGRDVIGVAETGSGKTFAFGVPCIRSILSSASKDKKTIPPARAVMISPTRELAVQIHDQIEQLAKPAGLQAVCVYGGVPKDPQRLALSNAHIVIATPGRLNDLIQEGAADLSAVTYLVLDEADRMLDKGFEDEIRRIINTTPSSAQGRQTLMFTATWPPSVRELAATFMRQPVHITIGENNADGELRANTRIDQKVEVVDPRGKEQRLLQLVKQYQSGKSKDDRILVFCLYKKEATRVELFLRSKGLRVAGIHGDLSQSARMTALDSFKDGTCPLLVATDVAARGLDIPSVKLVLNVTFPLTVEDYVHRIGR